MRRWGRGAGGRRTRRGGGFRFRRPLAAEPAWTPYGGAPPQGPTSEQGASGGGARPGAPVAAVAKVDPERCDGCGRCVEVCPTGAMTVGDDGKAHVEASRCRGCGACVQRCPRGAVVLS